MVVQPHQRHETILLHWMYAMNSYHTLCASSLGVLFSVCVIYDSDAPAWPSNQTIWAKLHTAVSLHMFLIGTGFKDFPFLCSLYVLFRFSSLLIWISQQCKEKVSLKRKPTVFCACATKFCHFGIIIICMHHSVNSSLNYSSRLMFHFVELKCVRARVMPCQ